MRIHCSGRGLLDQFCTPHAARHTRDAFRTQLSIIAVGVRQYGPGPMAAPVALQPTPTGLVEGEISCGVPGTTTTTPRSASHPPRNVPRVAICNRARGYVSKGTEWRRQMGGGYMYRLKCWCTTTDAGAKKQYSAAAWGCTLGQDWHWYACLTIARLSILRGLRDPLTVRETSRTRHSLSLSLSAMAASRLASSPRRSGEFAAESGANSALAYCILPRTGST